MGIGTEMRKLLSEKVNDAWLSDVGRKLKVDLAKRGFNLLSLRFKYCLGLIPDEVARKMGIDTDKIKKSASLRECYKSVKEVVKLPIEYRTIWESPAGVAISKDEAKKAIEEAFK